MPPKQSSLPPNFVFDFSPPNSTHASTANLAEEQQAEEERNKLTVPKAKRAPNLDQDHSSHLQTNSRIASSSSSKPTRPTTLLERRGFQLATNHNRDDNPSVNSKQGASSIADLDSDLDSVDKVNVGCIIKKHELKELKVQKLNENDSINNESDNISAIMRLRKVPTLAENNNSKPKPVVSSSKRSTYYELDFVSSKPKSSLSLKANQHHFSPQSSIRIKVIDETDTDN